jgi:hypothetical protein
MAIKQHGQQESDKAITISHLISLLCLVEISYCIISINLAGPMTCDGPAKNLVSATF